MTDPMPEHVTPRPCELQIDQEGKNERRRTLSWPARFAKSEILNKPKSLTFAVQCLLAVLLASHSLEYT